MLLSALLTAWLGFVAPVQESSAPPRQVQETSAAPNWLQITFEELTRRASAEQKVGLLYLHTGWSEPCKQMEREAFSDPAVVAALQGVLCLRIDAESRGGIPLAKRFGVTTWPALVWISPDGTVRDRSIGFQKSALFLAEAQRILADRSTVSGWRREVAADPENVEKHARLARKLEEVGDLAAAELAWREARRLDPEGKSPSLRRRKFEDLLRTAQTQGRALGKPYELAPLVEFLALETDPELAFDGWVQVASLCGANATTYARARDEDAARGARSAQRNAYREAWKRCPEAFVSRLGNELAWQFWQQRGELDARDKQFALEVAERAAAASELEGEARVNVLDTLACCLFMNGQAERAREVARRCIELEPDNEQWLARLKEFGG